VVRRRWTLVKTGNT
jgi:hypothetical protein